MAEPTATPPARYEAVTAAGAAAPWLVLVHGMSHDRRAFSAQVAAFRARWRLLLVDLPGHGLSSAHPRPLGLMEYAAAVAGALAAAGVERAHYWGTHTGAGVGLLLAARDPARFRSLVLEGPVLPGRLPPSVVAITDAVIRIGRAEGRAAALRHWWEQSPWFALQRDEPERCRGAEGRALVMDFSARNWLDAGTPAPVTPVDDALPGLRLPVLIVNGEHDVPDFVADAEAIAARLPAARRVVIPGGGGFPLWECPDTVNAEVARFLDAVESAR